MFSMYQIIVMFYVTIYSGRCTHSYTHSEISICIVCARLPVFHILISVNNFQIKFNEIEIEVYLHSLCKVLKILEMGDFIYK